MIKRDILTSYLSEYLKVSDFKDMAPNGLQVSGISQIKKIVTGVSASVELFEHAIEKNADAIIVHHGIIWDFERPVYTGGYRERVRLLLENNINLYAFHLPLDAHPEIGNNVQIGKALDVQNMQPFGDYKGQYIGMRGEMQPMPADVFFKKVERVMKRDLLIFPYGPPTVKTAGIISGGAQKEITQAVSAALDLYLTGEVSEHIMHYAKEEKIHFISAGHYATEKFGIHALGDHLSKKFKIEVTFEDIPNPV
jgi:dinuclear metal center YbgI/SA1388 family protein